MKMNKDVILDENGNFDYLANFQKNLKRNTERFNPVELCWLLTDEDFQNPERIKEFFQANGIVPGGAAPVTLPPSISIGAHKSERCDDWRV